MIYYLHALSSQQITFFFLVEALQAIYLIAVRMGRKRELKRFNTKLICCKKKYMKSSSTVFVCNNLDVFQIEF